MDHRPHQDISEIITGHGPLHVHIDYDEDGPYRVFLSLPPVGTEVSGLASTLGVIVSKYLEEGGDPKALLKHLQSVKGDRPYGLGENKVNSVPHGLGIALTSHLRKHGWLGDRNNEAQLVTEEGAVLSKSDEPASLELWNLSQVSDQCPDCFSTNIRFGAGCSGPICNDCGYSECN